MEEVKLKFYTIERCGYFKHGEEGCQLGDISDILDDLQDWISGLTLQQTQTTNILTAATEKLPVYCVGVKKSINDHYLLVTWNKVESNNGSMPSINKDAPINTVTTNLESTPLPTGNIPGYATYFWFIPEDNMLATIKLNHIENGHIGMNCYLKGFLTRFSKYSITVENEDDIQSSTLVGYGTEENYDENLHPYFTSKLRRLAGKTDFIRAKRNDITKLTRKTTISQTVTNNITLYEKLMYEIGLTQPQALNDTVELKYEIKTQPNAQELEDIITSWEEDHEQVWDDIGFTIKGLPNPLWLSSEVPSKNVELNLTRTNDEFVDFDVLLQELDNKINIFRGVYNGEE